MIRRNEWEYELVAASQSAQVIGVSTGTTRDAGTQFFSHLLIVPETLAAGTVSIKDGADTAIDVFIAGTLTDLRPFTVLLRLANKTGAWQVTTGANVHVIAAGRFT